MISEFKQSVLIPIRVTLLMWCFHLVQSFLHLDLGYLGIYPRRVSGLIGIVCAPLVHGDYGHIISNTVPFLVLTIALFYFYKKVALLVFVNCYLSTGALVWLFGRSFYHIGASGVVYGIAFFLMLFGLFRKDIKSIFISTIVVGMYGGLIYGLMPDNPQTSWESHLLGASVGGALAFYLRRSKRIE